MHSKIAEFIKHTKTRKIYVLLLDFLANICLFSFLFFSFFVIGVQIGIPAIWTIIINIFILLFSFAGNFNLELSGFSDDDLALEIQAKNKYLKDDLINALQIEREINKNTFQNVSEDLAHSFIQNISQKIELINLKEIFPIKSVKIKLLYSAVLAFGIIVFAFICTQDFSKAILQLRHPLKNYSEQNLAVKVIMPEIGDVSVKIFPPKYTKLAPYNGKDGGNVEALIGSNVCITAKANKPIEKAFLMLKFNANEKLSHIKDVPVEMNVNDEKTLEGWFKIRKDAEYCIEAEDYKKITTKSSFVNYVYALKDENPQIKILSPEQDLVVLPKSKIKIIYEASDDFGVKSVDLVCKKSKEISRLNICNRNNPFKNEILETEWDLSNLALQFSDAIEIYLEATDNDVITGPNKGVSNVIKIQVYDVNKEIEALTQDIDDEKLEDMIKNSERLYKRTQDFLSDLEKMSGKWDEEKTKKLRGDIERIAQLMENLQNSIAELSKAFPQEYFDSKSVKNMDFGKMNEFLRELEESLNSGDYDKALALAKALSEKLSSLMEMMAKAGNRAKFFQDRGLSLEANSSSKELEDIIKEEQALFEKTGEKDKDRTESLISEQEKLLKKLADLQQKILNDTKNLVSKAPIELNYPEVFPQFMNNGNDALNNMSFALAELQIGQLRNLLTYVNNAIRSLENMENITKSVGERDKPVQNELSKKITELAKNKSEDVNVQKQIEILSTQKNKIDKKIESLLYATAQSEELKLREIDILNEIKKADTELKEKYRTKEESALNKLSADQKETKSKTDKLLDKVKDFGKKLSLANPELGKNVEDIKSNLKIAGDSMDNASLNLKSADTGSALSKEAEALQHLSNSKEAFNSLMQGIESEGMSGAGKPQVRFLKPGQKGMSESGDMGVSEGYVKVPSRDEYQPPKSFREDIIEALKEKFPKAYQELLNEYYKRLIK